MANKHIIFTIRIDPKYNEDDVKHAIYMIKGVEDITGVVSPIDYHMAKREVKRDLTEKIYQEVQKL